MFAGPVDTGMSQGLNVPKVSPDHVAKAIFGGVERGEEDIFPHPMLEEVAKSWRAGEVKALERKYAALVDTAPIAL